MSKVTIAAEATAAVLLSRACDNACIFCAQAGLPEPPPPEVGAALPQARTAADAVTFVGGEPTLQPELPAFVQAARAQGFRRIAIQTNGARLDPELARTLAARGLTDVHLSIHGADPRVHDYHTGRAGSFERIAGASKAARSAGLRLSFTTVVTRSNYRSLSALPGWVVAEGGSAWMLSLARHAGRAAESSDRVVPRLGLAVPYALRAMEKAKLLGLRAVIAGVPSCLLGPFAARAMPEAPRSFAGACAGCDARSACAGVDPEYLARFGGDELRPVSLVAREAEAAALTSFFAGPGDLAPPRSPDAAAARRALPLLGKVQPGRSEVAPGGARKTGEALREILPDLFDERGDG